jgi:predicted RNA-binding protein YlxR (DUF448 family)
VRPQSELLRIARDASGRLAVDPPRWAGRGTYVCAAACLERAIARRLLLRALRAEAGSLDAAALRRGLEAAQARRGRGTSTPSTQRGTGGRIRRTAGPAGGL